MIGVTEDVDRLWNPPIMSVTIAGHMANRRALPALCASVVLAVSVVGQLPTAPRPIVLHAARMLDVKAGKIIKPAEILVEGDRIAEVGTSVKHPPSAEVIDLGDRTLMPGLIDAHIHLFLHPGAEDLQTVQESVPERTIIATLAARDDLMAGFTAERDMGTEGAGSADTAVRDAIDSGRIPGPRLRISGNADQYPRRARRCHRLQPGAARSSQCRLCE